MARRLVLVLAVMAMMVALVSVGPSGAASRWFKSPKGGYMIGIPKEWHVLERSGKGSYQAALSREQVQKEGDLYTYGVSIVRLSDYRTALKLTATDPQEMALEYATRLGSQQEKEGGNLVIALPGPLTGMPSWKFHIVKHGGTAECREMWLVIAIKDREWFHALWEYPCSESDALDSQVEGMVGNLQVFPKWGQ